MFDQNQEGEEEILRIPSKVTNDELAKMVQGLSTELLNLKAKIVRREEGLVEERG